MASVSSSRTRLLSHLEVGDRKYLEVQLDEYRYEQKLYQVTAARLKLRISTALCTAVLSTPPGAVRHLIAIERLGEEAVC
jgi:hypothetical protein